MIKLKSVRLLRDIRVQDNLQFNRLMLETERREFKALELIFIPSVGVVGKRKDSKGNIFTFGIGLMIIESFEPLEEVKICNAQTCSCDTKIAKKDIKTTTKK